MYRMFLPCVLVAIASTALADDPPATPQSGPSADAASARRQALEVLKLEEGVWDAKIEFPGKTPDVAPTRMTGVQTNTFVTGDAWIKNDFAVDSTYGGHGTWGYDSKKGKYVGIWVDTHQDYVRFDEGTFDAAMKTMLWQSELRQPDPYPPAKYRMTEEFRGDTRVLTMTATGSKTGKEVPLGTIVFTRRRS